MAEATGADLIGIATDVRDEAAVEQMVAQVAER